MSPARRAAAIAVLAGAVAAGIVADRSVERQAPPAPAQAQQMPVGARASAASSAFYCTGTTAASGGAANGTVVVANAGSRPLAGTLTAVPVNGQPRDMPIEVPAAGRTTVALADLVSSPYASALVVLDGGQAVVELAGTGPLGTAVTPCASSASSRWYFAEGVTTRDAAEVLSLFNPFPEDALVDLSFVTEEGQVTPEDLTGFRIPGRGLVALNLGDYVQRREEVSAAVVARTGRLVVARLQSFDGTLGRKGMSLALGTPSPGERWYFPEGLVTEGVVERFQLFNPASVEARVALELALEKGEAEPIMLTVPPQTRLTVAANTEARIPKDVGHAVTVRETTGVGIVAERTVESSSPARQGVAHAFGARLAARQWVIAAGQADASFDEWLVVLNPSSGPATVSVALLDGGSPFKVGALQAIMIEPGQRKALRLDDTVRSGPTPLLITSNRAVVVERGLYRTGGLGTAMLMAVPLRD